MLSELLLGSVYRVDLTPPKILVTVWGRSKMSNLGEGRMSHTLSSWPKEPWDHNNPIAHPLVVAYDGAECLPGWMQRKLSVLMTLDPDKVNEELPGIGRRISEYVYWVRESIGDADGSDAREESQVPRAESP